MKWNQATVKQLEEIAYHDTEACWADKASAETELMRRQCPKRFIKVNFKEKAVYK